MGRLSKAQQKVVNDLRNSKYFIEVVTDFREQTEDYSLADENLNTYYDIKPRTFKTLLDKNILRHFEKTGSLEVEVNKFKLK